MVMMATVWMIVMMAMAMMADVSMASQFFQAFLMLTARWWLQSRGCGFLRRSVESLSRSSRALLAAAGMSSTWTTSTSTSLRCLFSSHCHYRLHRGPDAPRQAHERQPLRREGQADEEVGRGGSFLFAWTLTKLNDFNAKFNKSNCFLSLQFRWRRHIGRGSRTWRVCRWRGLWLPRWYNISYIPYVLYNVYKKYILII